MWLMFLLEIQIMCRTVGVCVCVFHHFLLFEMQWDINTNVMNVVMGKVEGQGESWHGHVTAVTVAPEYRRQQLAKKLMNLLEDISDNM